MSNPQFPEIKLDQDNLYREETYTDLRAGTLRRLVPVNADGTEDTGRDVLFEGNASLMTPGGTLPLNFALEATTLADALAAFPEAAEAAFEQTVEELKRMQREQASSIVVPGQGGGGVPAGGMGGMPGGGKIQL